MEILMSIYCDILINKSEVIWRNDNDHAEISVTINYMLQQKTFVTLDDNKPPHYHIYIYIYMQLFGPQLSVKQVQIEKKGKK